MKSMFSMGFFSNEVFGSRSVPRMGQAATPDMSIDASAYLSMLNDAFAKYQAAKTWQAARPTWQQILGADASDFQNLMAAAAQDSVAAANIQSAISNTFSGDVSVTPADKRTAEDFISEANSLSKIIAKYPQAAPTGPAAAGIPLSTQLLIGGGILAAVGIVVFAMR